MRDHPTVQRALDAMDQVANAIRGAHAAPAQSAWVQWKGTELCADFRCTCGRRGHIDAGFAYSVRCGACGRIWKLPETLPLTAAEDDGSAIEIHMDEPDGGERRG